MGLSVFPASAGASFAAIQPSLKHTITSTGSVTLAAGTTVAYIVAADGGGGGGGAWQSAHF